MNKREIAILEAAYAKEVDGALNNHPGIYQNKSKLAKKLEADGYLRAVSERLSGPWPVTIEGYRLTMLGNLTYCQSCADPLTEPKE